MKKIAFFLILIAASSQLKAQSLQAVPDIKLNDGLSNTFKPKAYPSPQSLLTQPNPLATNSATIYNNMPVAKATSNDKMPVAPLGKSGVNYTMLIKKEKLINPAEQPLTQPIP